MKDFPLYRSPRAAILGTLLIAVPFLLLSASALGGLYAAAMVLFLLPTAACIAGAVGGLIPMVLGEAAGLIAMSRLFGEKGLYLTAAYTLPIVAAFVLIVCLRVPFRQACPALIGVHAAALAACFLLLQAWTDGRLYEAAGEAVSSMAAQWDAGDTLLYQLYSMGLIGLPEQMQATAIQPTTSGLAWSPEAREDLLLSLGALARDTLQLWVPNAVASQSILGGVACLLLPLRFGYIAQERRAFLAAGRVQERVEEAADAADEAQPAPVDFPDLGMPRLSAWYLPRAAGWQVGAALLAGYLLRGSANATAAVAGVVLYAAAHAVFTIQGAALVNFMQRARGTKRLWRVIVPIALMLFSVLSFIGIFDQISNIRGLRKPREPKEEI